MSVQLAHCPQSCAVHELHVPHRICLFVPLAASAVSAAGSSRVAGGALMARWLSRRVHATEAFVRRAPKLAGYLSEKAQDAQEVAAGGEVAVFSFLPA